MEHCVVRDPTVRISDWLGDVLRLDALQRQNDPDGQQGPPYLEGFLLSDDILDTDHFGVQVHASNPKPERLSTKLDTNLRKMCKEPDEFLCPDTLAL